MPEPLAKRHVDYLQIVELQTQAAEAGDPSLLTFVREELRDPMETEPDGYTRITKEQAEELVTLADDYAERYGALTDDDATLVSELRSVLDGWA